MRPRSAWVPASALAALLAGCNGVLGWESASLDPALSQGGSGGGAGATSAPCEPYCTLVMQNCRGDLAQYGSTEVCLQMCNQIEPGFTGETTTNTVACRYFHAQLAINDPTAHCRAAGPLGGGQCGSRCDAYCLFVIPLCSDQSPPPFVDLTDCRTGCSSFAYDPSAPEFTPDIANTLNCRLYHLESAYEDAHHHCPHTAVRSSTCQ